MKRKWPIVPGEGGAGKTSLARPSGTSRIVIAVARRETTKGIAVHRHEFTLKSGQRFRLNVWDFGGQETYHATHQFFLTRRSLYVLLDDTARDHKSASDAGFNIGWRPLTSSAGSPVLIFQNEKGGRSKDIDLAGIKGQYET